MVVKTTDKRAVLVVDDMGINLRTIKTALDQRFNVHLAKSGKLALSILAAQNIDLILLDIEMPEMSGFEFMRRLKNDSAEVPPVIFVTAHATPELLTQAKIAGAAGYVLKPFDPEVLRKKVNEVLGEAVPPPEPDKPFIGDQRG